MTSVLRRKEKTEAKTGVMQPQEGLEPAAAAGRRRPWSPQGGLALLAPCPHSSGLRNRKRMTSVGHLRGGHLSWQPQETRTPASQLWGLGQVTQSVLQSVHL